MALKKFKPTSAARRTLVLVDKSELWSGRPLKILSKRKINTGGRNNLGRITCRHKGGGHKKLYRLIDFKRNKFDIVATVERIEYDPNRTCFIALIKYEDGTPAYILAPQKLSVGDKIISSDNADIKVGNVLPIGKIPVGIMVHNVELRPGKGGQLARSAGSYAQIVGKDSGYVMVKLRSGEVRLIKAECLATIGVLSNPEHQNENFGKAGRMRWKGVRPTVRGVAMNPIDHPHGGGEGKTSGGRHPVTPWGKKTKGKKTRNNKRTAKYIVRSRHKNRSK